MADSHTDFIPAARSLSGTDFTALGSGALEPDGAYDEIRFASADLVAADAGGPGSSECLLDRVDLTEAHLKDTRWTDCRLDHVRGVGTELSEPPCSTAYWSNPAWAPSPHTGRAGDA